MVSIFCDTVSGAVARQHQHWAARECSASLCTTEAWCAILHIPPHCRCLGGLAWHAHHTVLPPRPKYTNTAVNADINYEPSCSDRRALLVQGPVMSEKVPLILWWMIREMFLLVVGSLEHCHYAGLFVSAKQEGSPPLAPSSVQGAVSEGKAPVWNGSSSPSWIV